MVDQDLSAKTGSLKEKLNLRNAGASIDTDLPTFDTQPSAMYHNPKTGQEHLLKADSDSITHYRNRGLSLGPASTELLDKWKAGSVEREATYDKRLERAKEQAEQQSDKEAVLEQKVNRLETLLEGLLERLEPTAERESKQEVLPLAQSRKARKD